MRHTLSVHLVKIPVTDIDAAVPFYRDVLGLEAEFVASEYGWAQFKTSNIPLALYVSGMGGGTGSAGEMDGLHLSVTSFNDLDNRLKQADIQRNQVFHTGNDGTEYYELNDPDGNVIKVFKV